MEIENVKGQIMIIKKEIEDIYNNLIGHNAKNVKLGHGSFVTMDFGKDISITTKTNKGISTKLRGEWHLWIYMCAWRLDEKGYPLVGSEDDRDKIKKTIRVLEGKRLSKITQMTNTFDMKLEFSDNIHLYLFAINTTDEEHWILFTPDYKVLTVGPSSTYSYEDSNESPQSSA